MKHFTLALTLAATLAAPLAASAQTWPGGTAIPNDSLLVINAQSGRVTIAQLAPVDGQLNTLHLIGKAPKQPISAANPAPASPATITIGQEEQVYDAYFREQFHIPSGF